MLRKARFILRIFGQDLAGNPAVHLAGASIIAAAFLTIGIFLLAAANLEALVKHWESRIQVSVYLKESADERAVAALHRSLEAMTEVQNVEFVDKDRALAEFKAMLGSDAELLDGIGENPLPMSFTVDLAVDGRETEKIEAFAARLQNRPEVETVDYGGAWIDSFSSAVRLVEAAVFVLGGLILISIVFIISNTIRLTMYARKDEIGIMKLVGASNLMIRAPFVIEGVVQGSAAASIAALALYLIYLAGLKGTAWTGVFAGFAPVFVPPAAVAGLVAGGLLLGALGSLSRVSDLMRG